MMMAYEIRLVCVLLLALGASASPYSEEKYVRELQENIERIPALLSGNEGASKINLEPFSELSKAMADLNIENLKSTFDYIESDGVKNVTEFAKYTWVRYDYITEYLRSVNRNDRNNMMVLIEESKRRGVLTEITEEVLQNNYLRFTHYHGDIFKTYANIPMCTMHRSRQQVIHDFYKIIVLADLMGTVIRAIFVEIGEIPRTGTDSHSEFQKFLSRQTISYDNIKDAMANASRSLYACDPTETQRNNASASLDLFEVGLFFSKSPYSCEGEEALTPCCKYNMMKKNRCASESWSMIKTVDGLTFCDAPKFKLPFDTSFPISTDFQSFSSSDVVSRICEDETRGNHFCISDAHFCITKNEKTDRYFHLGEVLSDSGKENKVVTGVKLLKEGNFFYIQIQQGKLGPRDTIDPNTIEWKKIENKTVDIDSYAQTHPKYKFPEVNHDFHTIHDSLAVNLDDITPPKNSKKRFALTGLRFVQEDGVLKLEVETKPYNYDTGILRGRNEWRTNSVSFKSRKELVLKDPIEPIHYNRQYEISKPGTFVKFQGTTMKKSIDEMSTVPFIDLQEIVTKPPSPVSGAGIFVRGTEGSGGYLSLKLITQDYGSNF